MRLCKDCRHFVRGTYTSASVLDMRADRCRVAKPEPGESICLVYGTPISRDWDSPSAQRKKVGVNACGEDGSNWEPKSKNLITSRKWWETLRKWG